MREKEEGLVRKWTSEEGVLFELGDHVALKGHLDHPGWTGFIEKIQDWPEIMMTTMVIRHEDSLVTEKMTNRGEIRVRLSKPVTGCDCYSCTMTREGHLPPIDE